MDDTNPGDQAKARRALRVLYVVMAVGMVLPVVLFLWLRWRS
jgi:type VI protein secretion system component VasF